MVRLSLLLSAQKKKSVSNSRNYFVVEDMPEEHSATYYNLRTRKEKNRPTCKCSPYPPCDDRHRSTRDWSVRLVIRVTARHICPPLTISGTAVRGQLIIKSLACNSHTVSDIFLCDTGSVQLAHLTEGLYVNRNAAGTTCI